MYLNFRVICVIILIFLINLINCRNGNYHPKLLNLRLNESPQRLHRRSMPTINFEPLANEEFSDYWNEIGQDILKNQLNKNVPNMNQAKNLILFLGDGMSIPTITAGRVYMGGEEKQFSFEKFPYVGLTKTYCANTQVADSACTATAYLTGVKANYATVGVSAAVNINDCQAQNNTAYHVPSIAKWAQLKGMKTGLITTTDITDASPAVVYAHAANRDWQNDAEILKDGADPNLCHDIAYQLIHDTVGNNLRVIFGGGREQFLPIDEFDLNGNPGKRLDKINLINEWKLKHQHHSAQYIQTRSELFQLPNDTEYAFGLFDSSHMPFHLDADKHKYPTLVEMIDQALNILEKNNTNGYFLFVEGGLIDHAHHDTEAMIAIDETIEFDKAIQLARQRTSEDDTLIVVTADHSHTMSIAGYSSRKNDIFGINNGQMGNDKLPYSTLSYANGPGFDRNVLKNFGQRRNLKEINMNDMHYRFPTTVPLDSETHGGDDVAIYASGPHSHLFTGSFEQNFIPHGMAYASCLGNKMTLCSSKS